MRRGPLNRIASRAQAYLLDEDEEGNEIELYVTVWFRPCPAEPDVGIMSNYPEVLGTSTSVPPWGEILFRHAEQFEDQIFEEADKYLND